MGRIGDKKMGDQLISLMIGTVRDICSHERVTCIVDVIQSLDASRRGGVVTSSLLQ
jgi:hypothetical protein